MTLVVEVTRGDVVEAWHRVHAVAVRDGQVELAIGEPDLPTFLRSSTKPLQALPVVRARPELSDRQVALLSASHLGTPEQVAVVESILADASATVDDLECGPSPDGTKLQHNCSGKHAGFLTLCRANGWPTRGYRHLEHPVQQAMLAEIATAIGVDETEVAIGVDGCGVPTFGSTLTGAATMFGRLPQLEGGDRVSQAMRAHPDLLRGPVAADGVVIRTLDGWLAKGGAEGLLCVCSDDGLGIALKIEDGSFRAALPALAEVLRRLGIDPCGLGQAPIDNSLGEIVGEIRVRATGQ